MNIQSMARKWHDIVSWLDEQPPSEYEEQLFQEIISHQNNGAWCFLSCNVAIGTSLMTSYIVHTTSRLEKVMNVYIAETCRWLASYALYPLTQLHQTL